MRVILAELSKLSKEFLSNKKSGATIGYIPETAMILKRAIVHPPVIMIRTKLEAEKVHAQAANGENHIAQHFGPNPGVLAIAFMALFMAGLIPVTLIASDTHFPSPLQTPEEVMAFFRSEANRVRICAFFQFCSAIPLGMFAATMVSRLRFHGAQSAAVTIALFGGIAASVVTALSALLSWVITQQGIASDEIVTRALHYMIYVVGGPGYSTLIGVLFLGISLAAGFMKLLPRGLIIFGVILGVVGELSAISLVSPAALFLIPLTRFPGFIWMIIAGFKLPRMAQPSR